VTIGLQQGGDNWLNRFIWICCSLQPGSLVMRRDRG